MLLVLYFIYNNFVFRVLSLERKKTEVITTVNKEIENMDNSDATEDEADIDEYLDWRSKKSFRA